MTPETRAARDRLARFAGPDFRMPQPEVKLATLSASDAEYFVAQATGQPGQLEGHARGLRYLVLAYPPGRARLAVMEALRSRDAAPVSGSEMAAWRAARDFGASMRRMTTDPGVTRGEVERSEAGLLALAANPDHPPQVGC